MDGVVPAIQMPNRCIEVVHNELKEDARIYAAETKITWDDYDFEVRMKIPMIFSEQRTMEVFQSVLDDVVKTMRREKEGSIWRA